MKGGKKKMKKSFVFAIAFLFALVAFSSVSLAAWHGKGAGRCLGGNCGRNMKQGFGKARFLEGLNLTQDQKTKFLEREQQLEKEILGIRQQNQKMQLWIAEELKKEKPNQAEINKTIDKIGQNRATIQKKRTEFLIWIKSQLSPEQKQKFDMNLQNRKIKCQRPDE